MIFWLCMLFVNLLLPAIMLLEGWLFMKKPPKRTNYIYGYRTNMSTKNAETWVYAHKTAGAYWWKWGKISLFPALILHLFLIGQPENVIGSASAILLCLLAIPFLWVIPYTERELNKHFHKNGDKRDI